MAIKQNEKIFKVAAAGAITFLVFIISVLNFQDFKKAFSNILIKEDIIFQIEKEKTKHQVENLTTDNKKNETLLISPILIAEISLGNKVNPPFIKIYNFSEQEIDLSEYSIKKLTSYETTLISQKRFKNKIIKPYSYLTLSRENENIKADIFWPQSYNITNIKGIAIYKGKEKIDETRWAKIPSNTTIKRLSWQEKKFAYISSSF